VGQIGITESESVAQIQAELLLSSTDTNPAIVVAFNTVAAIWQSYADKPNVYPRLQYFYTRRQAAEMLEGALRLLVDTEDDGESAKLSQQFTAAKSMRSQAEDEITRLETIARSSRPATVGLITTTCVRPLRQSIGLPERVDGWGWPIW
jgi:hypothetical protein